MSASTTQAVGSGVATRRSVSVSGVRGAAGYFCDFLVSGGNYLHLPYISHQVDDHSIRPYSLGGLYEGEGGEWVGEGGRGRKSHSHSTTRRNGENT